MTNQNQPEPTIADLIIAVQRLEAVVRAIASQHPPAWKRPLKAYKNGWVEAIGATAIASDQHGPTVVAWCGHTYTRRSGQNKTYGAAIWFSRVTGKDATGNNEYVRLITFAADAEAEADTLPEYVAEKLQ
jgi:hypothetical protein